MPSFSGPSPFNSFVAQLIFQKGAFPGQMVSHTIQERTPMADSNSILSVQASVNSAEIIGLLQPRFEELQQSLDRFRQEPLTPIAFFEFEKQVQAQLREAGRCVLEYAVAELEPDGFEQAPPRVTVQGEAYRRRKRQPKTIDSTFGPIEYSRVRYEACEPGERSIFPLDLLLGLEAHLATPALAECVGRLAVDHEQSLTLAILARDHGVCWSVTTLRKVTASLADGFASFREAAQVGKALAWLEKAFASTGAAKGSYRPVLAVGRDGIMIPMRNQGYKEASTATLAVYGRNKKRLGTLYLGRMPEPGQETLTKQLTSLIDKILTAWHACGGDCPRLVYLTDGGHHPRDFFRRVLRKMSDPWRRATNEKLSWQWILDYWHVCGYVNKLAVALFGDGAKAHKWFCRMRRWLRDRTQGITQVLRSASQHQAQCQLSKAREETFLDAYRFLRNNSRWMQYAAYRRHGSPIGSGVTEAACKTVFTQRLKRSGMSWATASGQAIVDLRIVRLSGVWHDVHTQILRSRPLPQAASSRRNSDKIPENAA